MAQICIVSIFATMNFGELVFTIFILYLLYKLVYNVIVPVSKVTTTVRNHMQQTQQEQMRNQQNYYQPQNNGGYTPGRSNSPHDSTTTDGEYIDFEEIK